MIDRVDMPAIVADLDQVKLDLLYERDAALADNLKEATELVEKGEIPATDAVLSTWNAATIATYTGKLQRLPTTNLIVAAGLSVAQAMDLPAKREISFQYSAAAHQIIYGIIGGVRGVMTFITTDVETGGEWLHFVLTIAGHEIDHVNVVYFDGQQFTHTEEADPGWLSAWGAGDWETFAFVSQRSTGDPDQVANTDLVSQSAILFPGKWTERHRQRGCAHVYFILYYAPARWPNGMPDITMIVKGKKVYDPREAGQSFSDPNTWAWSSNAALCIADFLTDTVHGLGAAYTDMNWTNIEDAADVCDEVVLRGDDLPEYRYTLNGVFSADLSRDEVLQEMARTIAGDICYLNGKWHVFPGKYRTPTLTLTEADLIGSYSVRTLTARADAVNAIKGTYLNHLDGYQKTNYPAVKNATYAAEDGAVIWGDLNFAFIWSPFQAQRIAKIMLERSRQGIEIQLTCGLRAYQLQVCDVVNVTIARFGWSAKTFEVRQVDLVLASGSGGAALAVQLLLRETASGIYDWNQGEETTVDVAPNTTLPDPSFVADPTNLQLASGTDYLYLQGDGTVRSAIAVSWTAPTDPISKAGSYEVQYKPSSSGTWIDALRVPSGQTSCRLLDVQDRVYYDVQIRCVNALGFAGAWVTASNHLVIGKTAAPANVSGLQAVIDSFGIRLQWTAVTDLDRSHYLIHLNGSYLISLAGTSYTLATQAAGTYDFEVWAVDTSGNQSATAAETQVIILAPAAPVPTYVINGPDITIGWAAVSSQFAVAEYDIRQGATFGTSTLVSTVKGLTFTQKVNWTGSSRTFWIVARDVAGNESAAGQLAVELILPGVPPSFQASVVDNNVLFSWGSPATGTLPIDHYNLYKGDTWAGAVLQGQVSATFATFFEILGGVYTYWLTAVDSATNEGTAAAIQAVVNEPQDFILRADQILDLGDGTATNFLIDGDYLIGPIDPTQTYSDHFTSNSWSTWDDKINDGYTYYLQPSETSGSWEDSIDYESTLTGSLVNLTWVENVLAGSVTVTPTLYTSTNGSDWTSLGDVSQAYATGFRYLKAKLTATPAAGTGLVQISQIRLRVSVQLVTETGTDTASAADTDGTEVTFTKNFVDIQGPPIITPQGFRRVASYSSGQRLELADHDDFSPGSGAFTALLLVCPRKACATTHGLFRKTDTNQIEWSIAYYTDQTFGVVYSPDKTTENILKATDFGTVALNMWYLVSLTYNGSYVRVKVNDTAQTSVAYSSGFSNGTAIVLIGSVVSCMDVALAAFWKGRALTDAELLTLYAMGFFTYADLTTDQKTSLISFWELQEDGGTRYDSHGSHDFTEYNSVNIPSRILPVTGIADFTDAPNPTGFNALLYSESSRRISGNFGWAVQGFVSQA